MFAWDSVTGDWKTTPTTDQLFIYDGWNMVMMLNALSLDAGGQPKIVDMYTWGLDLSGSIHGAGGVGGLLAMYRTIQTPETSDDTQYWYFHDANGNVGQVLRSTTLSALSLTAGARYEYDAYGNTVTSGGNMRFPERLQPVPLLDQVVRNRPRHLDRCDGFRGLGYWGYRYYSPRLGRWISRDPMEEEGGLNLYTFLANDPANEVDPQGLAALRRWWIRIADRRKC